MFSTGFHSAPGRAKIRGVIYLLGVLSRVLRSPLVQHKFPALPPSKTTLGATSHGSGHGHHAQLWKQI